MRHNAQRTIDLQDCLPADSSMAAPDLPLGSQIAIHRAFEAWQQRRGIEPSVWKQKRKPQPEQKAPPLKVLPSAEVLAERKAKRLAYKRAYNQSVRAKNAARHRARRAAMTPEQRRAECAKNNAYCKRKEVQL
jgi:hypothetical protein